MTKPDMWSERPAAETPMGFWDIVGISLTSGGVVATVFVFLSKAFLELQLSKALEKFKSDLEAEHGRASLKFGVLHEERKRHVLALYDATVGARSDLNRMLAQFQPPNRSLKEQIQAAAISFEKLHNAGVAARIVFSDDEYLTIAKMIDEYVVIYYRVQTIVQVTGGNENLLFQHHMRIWEECRVAMKETENGPEKVVRDQLRRVLGVA